jgi:hypothetical protein
VREAKLTRQASIVIRMRLFKNETFIMKTPNSVKM